MIALIFAWCLKASFYGAVVGIIVLLLQQLLKNYLAPQWRYLLWLLVLFKLLVPLGPASSVSIFNATVPFEQQFLPSIASEIPSKIVETVTKTSEAVPSVAPPATITVTFTDWLAIIWLIGMVACLFYFGSGHLLLSRKLQKHSWCVDDETVMIFTQLRIETALKPNLSLCFQSIITSPALFGWLKPVILLTPDVAEMTSKEKKHILLHEIMHVKSGDLWFNSLWLFFLVIHWFNPILWLCYGMMRQDMEIACDHRALRYLQGQEYKAYGRTLLKMAECCQMQLLTLSGDYRQMRARLKHIVHAAKWQKHHLFMATIGTLILIFAGGLLLTGSTTNKMPLAQQWEALTYYLKQPSSNISPEEKLLDAHTPYVGNASAVGNIIGQLNLASYGGKMAIVENNEGYQIIKQYDLRGSQQTTYAGELYQNSVILLTLVDNLNEVCFEVALNDGTSVRGSLNRHQAREIWGDLAQYTIDEQHFQQLLVELNETSAQMDWLLWSPATNLPPIMPNQAEKIGVCYYLDENNELAQTTGLNFYQQFQQDALVKDASLTVYTFQMRRNSYPLVKQELYQSDYAEQKLRYYCYQYIQDGVFADTYEPILVEENAQFPILK